MDPGNISSGAIIEEQAAARAESFARDGWIFLGLASAITLLRMYSRWRTVGFKRFQADDFLVMLALVSDSDGTRYSAFWVDQQLFSQGIIHRGHFRRYQTPP